jgi:phosphoglucomutase
MTRTQYIMAIATEINDRLKNGTPVYSSVSGDDVRVASAEFIDDRISILTTSGVQAIVDSESFSDGAGNLIELP